MSRSVMIAITALLLIALVALAGWGLSAVSASRWQGTAGRLEDKLTSAETRAKKADNEIITLNSLLDSANQVASKLQQQTAELSQQNASRAERIERLKRENETLRQWADDHLPDAISSMHTRPAITGAGEYQRWLSGTNPLPTTGSEPEK